MVSMVDSDSDSTGGDEEEKCFEVIQYDPDTEDVLKIWELTDLDVLEKFDELFPNFQESQCVLLNGVLYVRKGENLLAVDCEAGSEDGKYKGKLIHHQVSYSVPINRRKLTDESGFVDPLYRMPGKPH